jgi:hypothetical protein
MSKYSGNIFKDMCDDEIRKEDRIREAQEMEEEERLARIPPVAPDEPTLKDVVE